jgi:hypothetical protein
LRSPNTGRACGRIRSGGCPKLRACFDRAGRLVFLGELVPHGALRSTEEGVAATDRLLRRAFGLRRLEFPPDLAVEFHLSHGQWIRLLRRCGFEIEELLELQPPANATTRYPFVTLEWARQWPCEEVWKARKACLLTTSTCL